MTAAQENSLVTTTLRYDQVQVGDRLPETTLSITPSLIVGGALATRDFEKVHHDKAFAQSTGMPDIFMNILTSQGLMEAFITNWSGPETRLKKLSVRLGAPNVPGATMVITGEVKAKQDGLIEIEVIGQNDNWGTHMKGRVSIELPR